MTCLLRAPLGDAEALDAALRAGADALLFGPVAPGEADAARSAVRRARGAGAAAWVEVGPLGIGRADRELDAAVAAAPDGVLQAGAVGGHDLQRLAARLAVREAEHGLPAGRTGIVLLPADTPAGVLALGTLSGASPRLLALAWAPDGLARALGTGHDASPVRAARDLMLLAAAACGVPALDLDPGAGGWATARRDGFKGGLAPDPGRVAAVRAAFGGR